MKKHNISKYLAAFCLMLAMQFSLPNSAQAQCPMCRISAENNLKDGGTAGKGLNKGILYMLAAPYLIVGTIGFVWYKNRRKEEDEPEVWEEV